MKITKTELRKIIKEELLKEFGSEEYGLQTKEFEPVPGLDDAEMDNQVTADDFLQISRRLSKLYRRLDDMDQQDEVMDIRKQLVALRKRVTGA